MTPPTSGLPHCPQSWIGVLVALGMLPVLGLTLRAGPPQRSAASDVTPQRWGIGRAATPAEISALDIDVMPDGTGLPPGSGTVPRGAELYAERCEVCHGENGQDGPFAYLSGREPRDGFPFATQAGLRRTIGNYWPYATTLFDYNRRAMPFDDPGTLEPDEVYNLVAYLLFLNELVPESAVMDAATLPQVVMPARDRFVEDNRRGGTEIR